jgi:hypothetical protein
MFLGWLFGLVMIFTGFFRIQGKYTTKISEGAGSLKLIFFSFGRGGVLRNEPTSRTIANSSGRSRSSFIEPSFNPSSSQFFKPSTPIFDTKTP